MTDLDEETYVEKPFIEQLHQLGWKTLSLDLNSPPNASQRTTYQQVILEPELHRALQSINPWLAQDQTEEVVTELVRLRSPTLIEANIEATNLILNNTVIDENHTTGQKSPTVKYIDFEHPGNNRFLAISQFKINVPGYHTHIIPDIVLFVNGIPLVVVEGKSPRITDPMEQAINQLLRYSNNRPQAKEKEGNERLFHYNQFMIATFRQEARFSTIGGGYEHYLEWKDCYPFKFSDINPDGSNPNSQQLLIQGMLHPQNLLDVVENFTIFKQNDRGQIIKVVGRYQQYRAVQKIIDRLRSGKTPADKGGVIWHTQGSGKSLTMVFLIRKMRKDTDLRSYKIVFITDRTDLEKQLTGTVVATDETIYPAHSIEELKDLLRTDTSNMVMGMMQKFQEKESKKGTFKPFPILNRSDKILLLIDEAHRTQSSTLAANLARALPNCTRIAFTGTPLITETVKKKTTETFGEYIDKYTIEQSVKDGSTLQILYEGRTSKDAIKDGKALDDIFEDMFKEYTQEEREAIQKKYGTKTDVLEAPKRIEVIAADIIEHYRKNIMPNGFKAQVVTTSRRAAIRYKEALDTALVQVIEKLEKEPSYVQATKELVTIKRLETAVIISAYHNDPPEYYPYTDRARQDRDIDRFKRPLKSDDPDKQDGLAFLIVRDMLITGFDAPVEQVMYIDRKMVEHNLLQAIARVNRPASKKNCGYVVDYYGIGHHLKEALEIFSDEDVKGAMIELKDEIPTLEHRHRKVLNIFSDAGIDTIDDIDRCVDHLAFEGTRAEFIVAYKYFLKSMDIVLPNPAALPYVGDMKTLGFINTAARNRYRVDTLNIAGCGEKVRKLIDEHVISMGVDPKIPPISIMAEDFEEYVAHQGSTKARASEMEHAIRFHITKNRDYDPEYYKKLSEKLDEILLAYRENWAALVEELRSFLAEVREGRQVEEDGLDPGIEKPFFDILVNEVYSDQQLSDAQREDVASTIIDIVSVIKREINIVDFWKKHSEKKRLNSYIISILVKSRMPGIIKKKDVIATRFMSLAEKLDQKLKESLDEV
jgi:type I restriction enzyme R subunit